MKKYYFLSIIVIILTGCDSMESRSINQPSHSIEELTLLALEKGDTNTDYKFEKDYYPKFDNDSLLFEFEKDSISIVKILTESDSTLRSIDNTIDSIDSELKLTPNDFLLISQKKQYEAMRTKIIDFKLIANELKDQDNSLYEMIMNADSK
jgi:archaellum component FlaC